MPRLSRTVPFPAELAPPARRDVRDGALVHIGAGNFNRSHLVVYLDDLMRRDGGDTPWTETGVGLMPADESLSRALREQDNLYGVLERDNSGSRYRVVGALARHLFAPADPAGVIAAMADPACRVVSMTVTEGGYFTDDVTGFRAEDRALRLDLEQPDRPRTWLGFAAAAAELRVRQGAGPFTLLSCDNLQSNGHTARTALLAFAEMRSAALARWIAANVAFPNSMVDRITPRTTAADRDEVSVRWGIDDEALVVCEPFRQWVLEDEFAAGRPAWEQVGVEMTTDVAPYEKTKMRLLNGCHFSLAYAAAVMGVEYVSDAVTDVDIAPLLRGYHAEVMTTLRDLPGIRLADYAATVLERFANVSLRDQVTRICSEGTAKAAKFLAPPLGEMLAAGTPVRALAFVIASWLRYLDGRDDAGRALVIEDSRGTQRRAPFTAAAAFAMQDVFGNAPRHSPALVNATQAWLDTMRSSGMRDALKQFHDGTPE